MKKDPIEAFEWLFEEFRLYCYNQTTWLRVREVLREAEALREELHTDRLLTNRIIEVARDIRDIIYGSNQLFPKAELDDALDEYDNLLETSD